MVTGYPLLFNGTDCNLFTFFTAAEMARLNTATNELNQVISTAADPGLAFVAVAPAFAGHAVCYPAVDQQPGPARRELLPPERGRPYRVCGPGRPGPVRLAGGPA